MAEDPVERGDLEAALAVRRELGATYDAALVDSFAERIERAVTERAGRDLSLEWHRQQMEARAGQRQFAVAVISLVALTPITIVLGATGALPALLVVWLGVAVVNVAHAAAAARHTSRLRP